MAWNNSTDFAAAVMVAFAIVLAYAIYRTKGD